MYKTARLSKASNPGKRTLIACSGLYRRCCGLWLTCPVSNSLIAQPTRGILLCSPWSHLETLKDQIHKDLGEYSAEAVAKVARRTEQQSRATWGEIQNQLNSQFGRVVGELEERLRRSLEFGELDIDLTKQCKDRIAELIRNRKDEFVRCIWLTCKGTGTPIPVQIGNLINPCFEGATAKLMASSRRRLQEALAEEERFAQDMLEGIQASVWSCIQQFVHEARPACDQHAQSVIELSADRLNVAVDNASQKFRGAAAAPVKRSLDWIKHDIEEMTSASQQGLQAQVDLQVERRLEEVTREVQGKSISGVSSKIETIATEVLESVAQSSNVQMAEAIDRSQCELEASLMSLTDEAKDQFRDVKGSARELLLQESAGLTEDLRGLGQGLVEAGEQRVADAEKQLFVMGQAAVKTLAARMKQLADAQLEKINRSMRKFQEKAALQCEMRLREVVDGQYRVSLERMQEGTQ